LNRDGTREQVSAADYDPSLDRREDEQRRVRGVKEDLNQDVEMIDEDEDDDDDDDDVDDMFALSVADKKKNIKKVKKVIVCHVSCSFITTLVFMVRPETHYPGSHYDNVGYCRRP
jgi:serine/threonine-protein kinase PRP4